MRKVDKHIGMMRAIVRQGMILSDETDSDVVCIVRKATNDRAKYGSVHVGDYTVEFIASPEEATLNYEPAGRVDEWRQDIEDSRVHSLKEPPIKKAPQPAKAHGTMSKNNSLSLYDKRHEKAR